MLRSKFFTHEELKCKCGCGENLMQAKFLEMLDFLREKYGKPMFLSSAYRCLKHNESVGGVIGSAHPLGCAADIIVWGKDAHKMLTLVLTQNFTGVGLLQKGEISKRFIHVDNLPALPSKRFVHVDSLPTKPTKRPALWTY